MGGGSEAQRRGKWGKARNKGEASGGSKDQGKASGGSEKQKRDKWGEHGARRQGQRVPRDVHNRAEVPRDVHSRAAEPSDVHRRTAGPSDVHHRAAALSDVHRRETSTDERQHRATTLVPLELEPPQGAGGSSLHLCVVQLAELLHFTVRQSATEEHWWSINGVVVQTGYKDKLWTVVGHDHLQPVSVQGSTPRSPYVLIFNYSISPYHIRSLVASAEHCQQEVIYRCRKSRLFDTWAPSAVMFTFDLGDGPVVLVARSPMGLNDRQWHYVRAERNVKEASLQVDLLPLQIIEAATEGQHRLQLNSQLFVAISASFERGTSVTYAVQEPFSVMRNQDPKQLPRNKHSDIVRSRENVAFGFLTKHTPALLLSAQSHDQRYMAITLTQNGSLQIWYKLNQETGPDMFSLKPANLADGRFHWVRINRDGNQLHVQIDNTVMQQFSLSPVSPIAPVRILTLGRIRGSDITDEEVVRAGLRGFVGCLSSVQFNQAAPLKAALQNRGSSAVSVHGRLEESDCGAKSSTNTHITTHTGSGDESSKSDRGKAPLTKGAQSDSALIGGVVAAIVFMTLCVLAVLIRFLYQHREPRPPPAIAVKSKRPSLAVEPSKPSHVGKEYFI
ncbi:hypothetical protein QTP70_013012 [Hemibagrus guttatus]|uniref:Laminin G domain-containing protein n=1 Tax=Hemibagrus guttatus TaxID=175788 RepID=A0AAE0V3C4_9TELE|nr:hypothetical protein QTP70_013012 [Hemibagrus guttatus]